MLSGYPTWSADIPLSRPVAGVRVGLTHDGEYLVNPTTEELEDSQMDLIVAGTDSVVLMIEGYCDFLTEEQVLEVSCRARSQLSS